MPIRVLIADDSSVIRKAVRELLTIEPEIEIVGEACSFRQMVEMRQQLQPDIVVMDLHMTEQSENARDELKGFDSPLIAMSICAPDEGESKAKEIGAATFLDKMRLYEELVPRIRELALGA
jgi:NarL family two-component system response regulator LiaR